MKSLSCSGPTLAGATRVERGGCTPQESGGSRSPVGQTGRAVLWLSGMTAPAGPGVNPFASGFWRFDGFRCVDPRYGSISMNAFKHDDLFIATVMFLTARSIRRVLAGNET